MRTRLLLAALLLGGRLTAAVVPPVESGGWSRTPGLCTGYSAAAQDPAPVIAGQYCFRADFRLTWVSDANFSIYLGAIHDNDRAFLNSHLIGETGLARPEGGHSGGYRRDYPVRSAWLREGVNEIALEVRCGGMRCGPEGPALLLPAEAAQQRQWADTMVGLMIAGSLLLAGLIFLIIGWGGAQESFHRWFGFFVLAGLASQWSNMHDDAIPQKKKKKATYFQQQQHQRLRLP